jgi:hypothetical protein
VVITVLFLLDRDERGGTVNDHDERTREVPLQPLLGCDHDGSHRLPQISLRVLARSARFVN